MTAVVPSGAGCRAWRAVGCLRHQAPHLGGVWVGAGVLLVLDYWIVDASRTPRVLDPLGLGVVVFCSVMIVRL
jgi:hypothetical protein